MAGSRNRQGRLTWLAGVRIRWRETDDGEFFCSGCGGDRGYQCLRGRRRFTLLRVPILPHGETVWAVECVSCRTLADPEVLDTPTSTQFSLLLREGVQAIVLAVLAAGGTESRAVRATAVQMAQAGGYPECTEERLLILLAALTAGTATADGPADAAFGTAEVEAELQATLAPLAPHLAPAGREALLLDAARLAATDGPYQAAESAVLAAVGRKLALAPTDTERLLAQSG